MSVLNFQPFFFLTVIFSATKQKPSDKEKRKRRKESVPRRTAPQPPKQRSQRALVRGFHTWGSEPTELWTPQPLTKHQNRRPRTRTPTKVIKTLKISQPTSKPKNPLTLETSKKTYKTTRSSTSTPSYFHKENLRNTQIIIHREIETKSEIT
jgi:hypothetical protein